MDRLLIMAYRNPGYRERLSRILVAGALAWVTLPRDEAR